MWVEIASLFTDYNLIAIICLIIGLLFCGIECFVPGFGFFGIAGSVFIAFSIIFVIVMGGTLSQLLFIFCVIIIVISSLILIAVRSARFGKISKSPLVQMQTALPTNYPDNENNYLYLLNKVGVTETICKPIGKANIDGKIYQVITNGELIAKQSEIIVSEVDGSTIIVRLRS